MKYVRAFTFVLALLALSPALAQWQVPLNGIPVGRGGGVAGFSSVSGSAGAGAKCLLDTTPPTFATCPVSTPGGSNTQVQYNNAGAFGGITGATTNGTALTLVAPVLGTPASATLTNATGLPVSTGVSGLGTGVAASLAINTGSSGGIVTTNSTAALSTLSISSISATALAVGPSGAANSIFTVDASTASSAVGVRVVSAVTGGTAQISASDTGGANANIAINAKGTGTIGIGTISTGRVTITPATTLAAITGSTQCLHVNSSGDVTGTGADCPNGTGAILQASPADPTGATAEVMMGLGGTCKITPVQSTRVHLEFQGQAQNATANGIVSTQARYGTGVAPANAAAVSGTTLGSKPHSVQASANNAVFFRNGGNITGLAIGTAYWFDLAVSNVGTGTTATITNISCDAHEIP